MRWLLGILLGLSLAIGVQWRRQEAVPVLTVWVTAAEYDFLKGVNPEFEERFGVRIAMEVVPSGQIAGRLPVVIGSHRAPDIVNLPHTMIRTMVEQGYLANMTGFFRELDLLESASYGFKVMGDFYGIPYEATTDLLFYRKEAFPFGIERLETGMTLSMNYRSLLHSLPFMTGFGGNAVGFDNFGDINFYAIGLNSEPSVAGIRFMVDLLDPAIKGETDYEVLASFVNGASDLLIGPAHWLASLEAVLPDVGVMAIPKMHADYMPLTYMNLSTYQLVAGSPNMELATSYMRFLMSDRVLGARLAPIPVYRDFHGADPVFGALQTQLQRALPVPNQLEFNYLYGAYQKSAVGFVSSPQEISRILNEAVQELDQMGR